MILTELKCLYDTTSSDLSVLPLFPNCLHWGKLVVDNEEEIKNCIIKNHKHYVESNNVNNLVTPGTNISSENLANNPIFYDLRKKIDMFSLKIFKEFYCYKGVNPYICDMWSICFKPEEYSCKLHKHPNCIYAGVWYPFDDNTCISFHASGTEHTTWYEFEQDYDKIKDDFLPYISKVHHIKPEKNTILLFPSSLKHIVEKNINNSPRYSVAFNIFFKGQIGNHGGNRLFLN